MDAEARALLDSLDRQRAHVFAALDGLSDEQLRRSVLPSGWSCLGMVKHLALADEHYWFRAIVAGESLDYLPAGDAPDWRVEANESAEDVLALYRREIALADAIIVATPLDSPPGQTDPWWGELQVPDLRFIMLHMIAETACHAGHIDAARELLDGRQYFVV